MCEGVSVKCFVLSEKIVKHYVSIQHLPSSHDKKMVLNQPKANQMIQAFPIICVKVSKTLNPT